MGPTKGRGWWLRRFLAEVRERISLHDLVMMAAAIAFFFLLAIIPLVLLGTSAVGFLLGSSQAAVDQVVMGIRRIFPRVTAQEVEAILRPLVEKRELAGGLGILSFVWIGSLVFDMIALALTRLSRGRETRSFLRRRVLAILMVFASGSLFLLSLLAASAVALVQAVGGVLVQRLGVQAWLPRFPGPAILPTLLVACTFVLMYRIAPARPIPWIPAAVGGCAAGLLWHLAKLAFNWYLTGYARADPILGVVGGVIGVLLWVFYSALILLLGGVLAEALDAASR